MAACASRGDRVADIGTDHAQLPIFLLRQGVSRFAILTDIREGPLSRAKENIFKAHADARGVCDRVLTADGEYALRLGDGLSPIAKGEADIAFIAGMGGETIAKILEADPEKTKSIGAYVLQPRTRQDVLRTYVYGNKYYVIDENLVEENGRICEILVAASAPVKMPCSEREAPASETLLSEALNAPGCRANLRREEDARLLLPQIAQLRRLKEKNHPLLPRFVAEIIAEERKIAAGVALSRGADAKSRARLSELRIELLTRASGD
jgi:tRNA A22 N-methylase